MSPNQPQGDQQQPSSTGLVVRGWSLIITNVMKLAGIGLAINEAVIRPTVRDSVIALCALLVMGAQVAEEILLRMIDRIFGANGPKL